MTLLPPIVNAVHTIWTKRSAATWIPTAVTMSPPPFCWSEFVLNVVE